MTTKAGFSAIGSVVAAMAAVAGAPAVAAQTGGVQCPPRSGQAITINVGDIDCVTASDVAAQYDLNGDKFQRFDPFTCYSGNAMTAPLLFTCVADTADRAEFAVYPE